MFQKKYWLRLGVAPMLAAVAMFGAACGGDDDDDTNGGNGGDPTATAEVPEPATEVESGEVPEGAAHVDQDNLKFEPNSLTVAPGTEVYFQNSESAIHNVVANGTTLTENMREGDVYVWTAPSGGTYRLTCDFHPQMKATITVE